MLFKYFEIKFKFYNLILTTPIKICNLFIMDFLKTLQM